MVYSPSTYLISAAVAAVVHQIQRTSVASLFYEPFTVSNTVNEISNGFPGFGAEIADKDCKIEAEADPTLSDVTTISTMPVTFTDLLANSSVVPTESIFEKVGTKIQSETTPITNTNHDAYVDSTSSWTGNSTYTQSRTGVNVTNNDCATGWTKRTTTRKLRDSAVAGRLKDQPLPTPAPPRHAPFDPPRALRDNAAVLPELESPQRIERPTYRHLESNANKDIAKLEAFFGSKMEMTLAELPTESVHTPSPWAGPYWPTYQDSINIVWSAGQPSPAEKYATAFGLDVMDFMDKVSKNNGVDSQSQRKSCQMDRNCETGSKCAIRAGKTSGYCIPTWFGICYTWAPAAILEEEPNCPVTHNGVTFQPIDIKALVSIVYDGAGVKTVFTCARYNGGDDTTDAYGRHTNAAYRDMNPAYVHIAAANILGKLNATFVVDIDAAAEVWNQPVRGFKVYEQTAMSLEEAAQTFYGLEKYSFNSAAKSIVYVKSRLSWVYETYTDGGLVS